MYKLSERVSKIFMDFASLIIAFITVAITYGVIGRKIFAVAPTWVNDVTSYGLLALTFTGGAYVALKDGHVRVDLVLDRLSETGKYYAQILSDAICFIACAVFAVVAGKVALEYFHQGTRIVRTVELPKWLPISILALGAALVALIYAGRIINKLLHRSS